MRARPRSKTTAWAVWRGPLKTPVSTSGQFMSRFLLLRKCLEGSCVSLAVFIAKDIPGLSKAVLFLPSCLSFKGFVSAEDTKQRQQYEKNMGHFLFSWLLKWHLQLFCGQSGSQPAGASPVTTACWASAFFFFSVWLSLDNFQPSNHFKLLLNLFY